MTSLDTATAPSLSPKPEDKALAELAQLIKAEHAAVISAQESLVAAQKTAAAAKMNAIRQANVVSRAIKAGELLKEAKNKMDHGH
jgi:hypothetical protein